MILVTGAAGFIGYHVCTQLTQQGNNVIGIDNINEYYDPSLKLARLERLLQLPGFLFKKIDLCDFQTLNTVFKQYNINRVCHLAAQAGVRYSLTHPFAYQKSNNEGFLNIIELARQFKCENFVYASSSSVYGLNSKFPFSETDPVDHPISLYAATKRSNELVAFSYSHLFNLSCSGLRFFTVYGPWGRPDMALFIFTKSILENKPIQVYNNGEMERNFTFIEDIVDGIVRVLNHPSNYEIYNIGNNRAEKLLVFIENIERSTNCKASIEFLPMQPGDVKTTIADISKITKLGYIPKTNIPEGIDKFVQWFRQYYKI